MFQHGIGVFVGFHPAARRQRSDPPRRQRLADRVVDTLGGIRKIQLLQHHLDSADGRQRANYTLARVFRSRSVDRFEHAHLAGVYVARRRQAHPALYGSPEIGDDSEELALSAQPNPFNAAVVLSCRASAHEPGVLEIFSLDGSRVASLSSEEADGKYRWTWDGRCNDGNMASSGTYIAQARIGRKQLTTRMQLVK